jgi:pimeloyl-ACP methyl ester carboxylesterase
MVVVPFVLLGVRLNAAPPLHTEGSIGPGSNYEIDVPDNWNGDLVLYAHGIIQADEQLPTPSMLDGYDELRAGFLAYGYAIAASSYSSNGWAMADAVQRTHQLGKIFTSKYGKPKRIFLVGHSLGALVVTKLAETYPTQYAGAMPMCGPLGGTVAEIQYAGDARVLFDHFFPGVLPGTPFEVPPGTVFVPPSATNPGSPLFWDVVAALTLPDNQLAVGQWVSAAGLPGDDMDEAFSSAMYLLGFNLRYTNDLIERVNAKLPYDNTQRVYRVTVADDGTNAYLSQQLNATVDRLEGDPAALNFFLRNYEPTGKIGIPVLTLHTTRDPAIPIWHEGLYAAKVAAAGRSSLLRQYPVDAWGHCAIPGSAIFGRFAELVRWVNSR